MRGPAVLRDLALLIESGVAPREAAARIGSGGTTEALRSSLARGRTLAAALREARLASGLETGVVDVAEHAGRTADALRFAAANAEQRERRVATLSARLWLPNVVLAIAVGIAVVRAAATGAALAPVVTLAVLVIAAAIAVTRGLRALLRRDASVWLAVGWRTGLVRVSPFVRRHFEQTFYTLLAWQLESGVDPVSGSKRLAALVDAPAYRSAVRDYRRAVAGGGSVTAALESAGLLQHAELATVLRTGEAAGRLPAALQHYLSLARDRREREIEFVLTWLPRIAYVVVLVIGGALTV